MIRDLNISEMERVSGGTFDDPETSHWLAPTMDEALQNHLASMFGISTISGGFGGDEVVATGTVATSFWGNVFNALDLNGDGDLYDEAAVGLGAVGVVLGTAAAAATAPIWIIGLGVASAASFFGGLTSGYMDQNPAARIW